MPSYPTRIPAEQLSEKRDFLLNRSVHVITTTGVQHYGILKQLTADQVTIQDPRFYIHQIAMNTIHELVTEERVSGTR